MQANHLSARSWIIFLAGEFVLAGILLMLGAFSGLALFLTGVALFGALWVFDNKKQLVTAVGAKIGAPGRWLRTSKYGRIPVRDAAAIIYERTRADDIEGQGTEHERLSYHVQQLLRFAKSGDLVLYGRVPPSRLLEPMRTGDLESLSWNDELDGLRFLGANEEVRFADINIDRSKILPLCQRIQHALDRFPNLGRR